MADEVPARLSVWERVDPVLDSKQLSCLSLPLSADCNEYLIVSLFILIYVFRRLSVAWLDFFKDVDEINIFFAHATVLLARIALERQEDSG